MPQTVNEKLDEILDLASMEEPKELVRQPAEIKSSGNQDVDMQDDYDIIRSGMRNLIEKTSEAVDNANFLAKEKQDARSVEAASMVTKEQRENLMALMNLHKTRKEIERVSAVSPSRSGGDTNVTQTAVFVGNTTELLKMTKDLNAAGGMVDVLKTINMQPEIPALNSSEEEDKNA
jgi:Terminase DNA packaging enzyme